MKRLTPRREALLLGAIFLLSLPAVTTRIYASDEINYYVYLRSLWFDRDLSFDNEYRYFYDHGISANPGFVDAFLERTTETGLRVNFGTVGCALLWAPFYAVADLLVRVFHLAPADGYSKPYVAAVSYASTLYGFLALGLSVGVAKRGLLPAFLVFVGTPLLFYMYVAPPMSHACSAFAVALFVWTWLRVREEWTSRGLALLGGAAALMVMVREQDLFFVGGPALDLTVAFFRTALSPSGAGVGPRARNRKKASVKSALVGAAAFTVAYLPQAFAYLVLNGRLGPSRLVTRKMAWSSPHAAGVLFSPEHGFLVWTPLAILSLVGLLLLAGQRRKCSWIALCALVMLALQVYVSGAVESWTVAGAFGQRRFVGASVLLVLGLAALMERATSRPARAALGTVIAFSVWWNLGLMIQFGTGLMDRQKMELGRNAHNTFVVVPRYLPELAYRYVFDRESFYRREK